MMRRMRLASLAILSLACTSSKTLQRPVTERESSDLTAQLAGREITIRLVPPPLTPSEETASAVQATGVTLDAIGVEWTGSDGAKQSAPAQALVSVKYLSPGHPRAHGALEGAGAGFLIGALSGAVIGFVSGNDRCNANGFCVPRFSAGEKALGGGIVLGLLGAVIGTVAGAIAGHHDELVFTP